MYRSILPLICLLFFVTLAPFEVGAQIKTTGSKINTIIIDAGHGGTDPGARGRYSTEAQITLAISLKLEQAMKALLPDTRIVMTRNTDIYHSVREKANIANSEGGDLFVCIHVNAAPPVYHKQFLHYKTVTYFTGKARKRKSVQKKNPFTELGQLQICEMVLHLMFLRQIEVMKKHQEFYQTNVLNQNRRFLMYQTLLAQKH